MKSFSKHLARPAVALLMLTGLLAGNDPAFAQIPAPPRDVRVYSGNPTAPNATVAVAPSTASVQPGGVMQFAATVSGTTNTTVVWSATGGTISSSGAYTGGSTPGTFRVTATISGGTIAGSATVTIQTSSPGANVSVAPGQNVQAAIDSVAEGAVILIKAGVHRLPSPIAPRNRQTIVGEPGAILSGARLLTDWVADGSDWKIMGQTQQAGAHTGAMCLPGYRCREPEDLFRDNVRLIHVASRAELGPGKWFFDYGSDTIYVRDSPLGHSMETSVTQHAIVGPAAGVTVRDLVIEKFANRAQTGAIGGGRPGQNWTIRNNVVRFNHGGGVEFNAKTWVYQNKLIHNGQLGVHTGGGGPIVGAVIEDNEIAHNNAAGFDSGWEAGGSKFVHTDGLIVRDNWVHHNAGPGLWTDIDNINTLYEGNLVEDNYSPGVSASAAGIFHEISYSAVIRNNTIRRNGLNFDTWGWGAGILIAASGGSGVEIYGNVLEDNKDGIMLIQQPRGSGRYGPYLVQNVHVHDNTIRMREGWSGAVQDGGDNAIFTSRNNRFENNTYHLGSGIRYFAWMNGERTESEWRSFGQDVTGTFIR